MYEDLLDKINEINLDSFHEDLDAYELALLRLVEYSLVDLINLKSDGPRSNNVGSWIKEEAHRIKTMKY